MTRIHAMAALLAPIKETSQLFNDRGILIDTFTPAEADQDSFYRSAATLFDPEDMRRARSSMANGEGKTTAELLEYLRSLSEP